MTDKRLLSCHTSNLPLQLQRIVHKKRRLIRYILCMYLVHTTVTRRGKYKALSNQKPITKSLFIRKSSQNQSNCQDMLQVWCTQQIRCTQFFLQNIKKSTTMIHEKLRMIFLHFLTLLISRCHHSGITHTHTLKNDSY